MVIYTRGIQIFDVIAWSWRLIWFWLSSVFCFRKWIMYDYVALRCFWQYGLFVRKIGVYAVYAQVPTGSEANYFVCNFGVDCCGSVGFSICHREPLLVCFLSFKTSQCMISLYYMISHLFPIGSMYAIYGNIYHQYTPNVSIYTIHGSYGFREIYGKGKDVASSGEPGHCSLLSRLRFYSQAGLSFGPCLKGDGTKMTPFVWNSSIKTSNHKTS